MLVYVTSPLAFERVNGRSSAVITVPSSDKVPSEGRLIILKITGVVKSGSVPANVIVTSVCSVAATSVCGVATGTSLTAAIARLTVAASESTVPSLTLNVKLSSVAESDVLVYVTSPLAFVRVNGRSSDVITVPSSDKVPLVGDVEII